VSGINRYYVVLGAGCACLLWGWRWLRGARTLTVAQRRWIAAVTVLLAMVAVVLSQAPRPDHAEHVHASYLRSLGLMPYIDYFQHHHPTLYFVMGAVYRLLPRTPVVSDVAAAVSGLLLIAMAALVAVLARRLWGLGLGLWAVVLLVPHLEERQFLSLRPDLAANLLVLASVWLLAIRRDLPSITASGALLGFAFWFGPKAWPFLLLAPLMVLTARPLPARWWWQIACHLLGVAVSVGLFLLWLGQIGLLGPWYEWCIEFNAGLVSRGEKTLRVAFPLILTGLAAAGWLLLRRERALRDDRLVRALLAAAVLAVAMGIQRRVTNIYDLQLPVLLFAALGAEPARQALSYLNRRSVLLSGAALALYFGPFLLPVARGLRDGDYFEARAATSALVRVAGDEPVVGRTPYHPLVTRDAVDLWHAHQSTLFLHTLRMRQRLAGIGPELRAARPPLVLDRETTTPSIIDALHDAGIVDDAEANRLRAFFAESYVMRELRFGDKGSAWFWIRSDRLPYLAPP